MTTAKKIAKNSTLMYGRMIITMIVSLFTSRVILSALGIIDFGIYNLVGSITVMFTSIRTVFCSSTQRFINYEIGKGDKEKVSYVFNMSIMINIFIGFVFLLSVEGVGIWFIYNEMNIEIDRFFAANFVFQISVATALIGLIMTSFDAVIVAHERMDFYAGMAIVDVLSRLLIAYALTVMEGDRLILYSIMVFSAQILVYTANYIYCRRNFTEVKFRMCWDKVYLKKMTVFAGWNFLGNTSYALTQNGINMVLNIFGGPIVNAARGIAFQVNTALQQAINNIAIVIKPYAIQTYAKGEYSKAFDILYLSSKIYYTVQIFIVIIFTFFTKDIIQLWLGQVPQHVVPFLVLILWYSLVRAIHNPIDILFFSVGDLKIYQISEGIVLATPIVFSYVALRMECAFYSVFAIQFIIELINLGVITFIAKRICNLNVATYFSKVLMPCGFSFLIYLMFFYLANNLIECIFFRVVNTIAAILIQLVFIIFFGCSPKERKLLFNTIKDFIKK